MLVLRFTALKFILEDLQKVKWAKMNIPLKKILILKRCTSFYNMRHAYLNLLLLHFKHVGVYGEGTKDTHHQLFL